MNQITVSNQSVKLIEKDGKLYASSLEIAERFKKQHKDVLKAIANIECPEEFNQRNFAPIFYQDDMNRTQPAFLISRDGLAFLIMGFTGKKAAVWKVKYIETFNRMESILREKQSEEWKKIRIDGKGQRREFTDALKILQQTAVEQGSQTYKERPQLLYSTYTNMVQSKLFPEIKETKNIREQLSSSELLKLSMLEQAQGALVKALIRNGISYKEVLPECKKHVEDYKDVLNADRRAELKKIKS